MGFTSERRESTTAALYSFAGKMRRHHSDRKSQRQDQQQRRRHPARVRHCREHCRDRKHPDFSAQNQLPPVKNVADRLRGRSEQKKRQRRSRLNQGDVRCAAGQRCHQPRRTDRLHERPDVRNKIRNQQIAKDRDAQRMPRASRSRDGMLARLRRYTRTLSQCHRLEYAANAQTDGEIGSP